MGFLGMFLALWLQYRSFRLLRVLPNVWQSFWTHPWHQHCQAHPFFFIKHNELLLKPCMSMSRFWHTCGTFLRFCSSGTDLISSEELFSFARQWLKVSQQIMAAPSLQLFYLLLYPVNYPDFQTWGPCAVMQFINKSMALTSFVKPLVPSLHFPVPISIFSSSVFLDVLVSFILGYVYAWVCARFCQTKRGASHPLELEV